MTTLGHYSSIAAVENATAADYTAFLVQNFGNAAAKLVEKYYPLSLFEALSGNSTGLAVVEATGTVITDSHFKCPGYLGAVEAAQRKVPVWTYEFTHNSSCVWLDTMSQAAVSEYGATHTAELPYLFGTLDFNFSTSCNATPAEYRLGAQMRSLWTAMAENADPSTDAVSWPRFQITKNGSATPGLIIGNSTEAGLIDFSVCKLWDEINGMILAGNSTRTTNSTTTTPSGRPTASSTSIPDSGAVTISSAGGLVALSVMLMGLAVFV